MKKVAIVNRTNLKNYGSVLQVYALCEAVKNLGNEAQVIWEAGNLSANYDFRANKIMKTGLKLLTHPWLMKPTLSTIHSVQQQVISEATVQLFDEFVESYIERSFYPKKAMNERHVGRQYDKFICGSDQIWCTTTLYVDPLMYLRFAPKEKRIAYAPSLGRDYIPDYNKREMKRYILDIPNVSVREVMGQKLIRELTGRDVEVVLDPTLLVEKTCWDLVKTPSDVSSDYILCYFLSTPTQQTQLKLLEKVRRLNKPVIALNSRLEYLDSCVDVYYPDCGPREFISFIENADCVMTDSYHGMLLSIIYHKQFWSIAREYGEFDQSSRQRSVLDMLGLQTRYYRNGEELAQGEIDYTAVERILLAEREKSLEFLRKALE